jgi:hypothetical protein
MAMVAGFPGLSQLLAWPTEHLTEAADHWQAVGGRNYEVANGVWQDALSIDWQGDGGDAVRAATHADMTRAGAVADQLQAAAKVARGSASDLHAARSRVRYAVEDAHTGGFDVGEDMSVTDRSTGGSAAQRVARQAQAQALAADIRQRAAQLVALDQQVAGKVTAAVAGIRDTFPESPAPVTPPRKPEIQSVDNHTFKQDPAPPPDPSADPRWKNLPPPRTLEDVRDALRQLRRGKNPPVRELDTPDEIKNFWDWLTKSARDLPPRGDTTRRILDDGTEVNLRPDSTSGGPTIEVVTPGSGKNPKVHLPLPFVDDPPELPPVLNHPPMAPAPPAPGSPPPTPLPPTQFSDPADLPPWLQNPSPPGFSVSPLQQPPVFGWDRPDAPAPPVPHPAPPPLGGPSWLPEVGHDLSEGGKKVFGWVVVGGILVWTILSGGGQGGEAAVP